jgi:hypothetical protein
MRGVNPNDVQTTSHMLMGRTLRRRCAICESLED